jgi:dipeptidyl aminopeptidase/acylaminoacyl peptidase
MRGAARGKDYSDIIDLVEGGIKDGYIDKNRVGIGGWSYGGYLSYLALTRDSTFHFKQRSAVRVAQIGILEL